MNLTERQQQALEHASDVLAETPGYELTAEWIAELRGTLRDILAAFNHELAQDEGGPGSEHS